MTEILSLKWYLGKWWVNFDLIMDESSGKKENNSWADITNFMVSRALFHAINLPNSSTSVVNYTTKVPVINKFTLDWTNKLDFKLSISNKWRPTKGNNTNPAGDVSFDQWLG